MALRVLEKAALPAFVEGLAAAQRVVGPVQKDGNHVLQPIRRASDLSLQYTTTVLPPKQYLFPAREKLLSFTLSATPQVTPVMEAEPLVLFGIHACDIVAINQLDRVFADTNPDQNYLVRRAATTIIGVDCVPDDKCYCEWTGAGQVSAGYDLFLTDLGDLYAVDVASERGQALLDEHARTGPGGPEQIAAVHAKQEAKAQACTRHIPSSVALMPLVLTRAEGSDVWKQYARRCFACGSCNLVCPTCYCFDVLDRVEVTLTEGARLRQWDGCLLEEFAAVASGENFREHRENRLFHRVSRKFHYQYVKYGQPHCVGCGRCGRTCVAGIDQIDIITDLLAESEKGG